jgi:SPX domain protein involved in polyphosphate accumulation
MKFGKNLAQVIEFSDPEWGPYWMNYKYLKKKIYHIVNEHEGRKSFDSTFVSPNHCSDPHVLSKSAVEVEFFRLLKNELKKTNDFFKAEEKLFQIRKSRVWEGFNLVKDHGNYSDKTTWTRLSMACVKFYEDVLLLENFAIMNYCGFSKILKKHDKVTG